MPPRSEFTDAVFDLLDIIESGGAFNQAPVEEEEELVVEENPVKVRMRTDAGATIEVENKVAVLS